METGFMNRIIGLVLALVVGGLLVGGLLIPSIEGMTATEKTFENDGYYKMTEIKADTDCTIIWEYTTPNIITTNGVESDLSKVPIGKEVTIVGSDKMGIRYDHRDAANTVLQVFPAGGGYFAASIASQTNLTITIAGFEISATDGTTTRTATSTMGAYIEPAGEWVLKLTENSAYIHKNDSVIVLAGITNVSTNIGVYATGTIAEGLEYSLFPTTSGSPTLSAGAATFNYTEVAAYTDLVKLSDCTFDITENSTNKEADYTYFLVPDKVTAQKAQPLDTTEIAMFGVISILGIVALVVLAANGIRNKY